MAQTNCHWRQDEKIEKLALYFYSEIKRIQCYDTVAETKYQLYSISHRLYSGIRQLENYLSHRSNELFDIEDKIILYDLTNTYFEGRMQDSQIGKFGRSKEKRSDARLVVLAMVVNRENSLKYSNILDHFNQEMHRTNPKSQEDF